MFYTGNELRKQQVILKDLGMIQYINQHSYFDDYLSGSNINAQITDLSLRGPLFNKTNKRNIRMNNRTQRTRYRDFRDLQIVPFATCQVTFWRKGAQINHA